MLVRAKRRALLFRLAVVQGRQNSHLENVAVSFVHCIVAMCWYVTSLNLSRIASFKRSWELLLEVSTWLYVLSFTLKLNNKKKCEAKHIFHYIMPFFISGLPGALKWTVHEGYSFLTKNAPFISLVFVFWWFHHKIFVPTFICLPDPLIYY